MPGTAERREQRGKGRVRAGGDEERAADKICRVRPLGRWQEPQDIAHLALFLASPLAKNITGQAMNVDGGWVLR